MTHASASPAVPISAPSADRLVHLAGVRIGSPEPVPDTLQFHLRTPGGDEIVLDLRMLLSALAFVVQNGAVPPLPSQWYNQVWSIQGVRPAQDGHDPALPCETDITALLLFVSEGKNFWVSPGTLLQCLQVAVHESRLPPLDPDWVSRAIPPEFLVPRRPAAAIGANAHTSEIR